MNSQIILKLIIQLPPLMLAISVHEMAHGYMAFRKGDYTAKLLGRVTLNPIKHIDPVGTILVPLMLAFSGTGILFGWAKPVPVNSFNFKSPRKDNAIVSLAGPASNFAMAGILALVYRILLWFPGYADIVSSPVFKPLAAMVVFGIHISVVLGVLNLIPVYPLDGSHIVEGILPAHQAQVYSRHDRYGFIILLALMFTGLLWRIIDPFYSLIIGLIGTVFAIPI
ncbi:MAG: site-2 protease family protein [bacterium]|nr:site-2 protease family protein [bacterium]MDT8367065.1 site-2 protease family protein [bacterium]